MNYTDYKFSLDIHEIGSQVYLTAKQGDTNRRLCASLVEGAMPYQISGECVAVFTAKKPDGNIIFNNCTIADNVITYEITEQTVAAVGEMACELRLYGADNALLISPRFTLNVVPAVFTDSEVVESITEVSTLTALLGEAAALIYDVNSKLENGDFIPQISVGSVETLPAGQLARVEITGSGDKPVLNFAIPQGPVGTNEELIPDTELSEYSTKPVQNRVIAAALRACEEATNKALETKVNKAEGLGLSTNDFTDEEKEKLAGIAESANKYSLPVGGSAIGGVKNGGDIAIDNSGNMTIGDGKVDTGAIANSAVTAVKLAADAKSKGVAVTLAAASWSSNAQTVSVSGVTASNNVIVAAAPESRTAWNDAEVYCSAQGAGTLTFKCGTTPTAAITANVIILV